MITDEEMDALREIADRIRIEADSSYYGMYNGGDPREFSPDPECSTDEERALHAEDCAAWERGEPVDRGPRHVELDAPAGSVGHVTVAHYGLGMVTWRDEELIRLAQDLDDVIDRIRQVPA